MALVACNKDFASGYDAQVACSPEASLDSLLHRTQRRSERSIIPLPAGGGLEFGHFLHRVAVADFSRGFQPTERKIQWAASR